MVEIRSKVNYKLLDSGIIKKENKKSIRLEKSKITYKKENVIIQYLMFCFFIFFLSCSVNKNLTNSEKENIKKTDSIIYENYKSLELDILEEQN